jgi:hypothetical protein
MSELKHYEIFSSSDWDTSPDYYLCDKTIFQPVVDKARKALSEAGGDYMVFWYVDENPDSLLIKRADDNEEVITTIDGDEYSEFTDDDCEITWKGLHLKVFKDAIQLNWDSKHTDEKLWCDIE